MIETFSPQHVLLKANYKARKKHLRPFSQKTGLISGPIIVNCRRYSVAVLKIKIHVYTVNF